MGERENLETENEAGNLIESKKGPIIGSFFMRGLASNG